MPEEPAALAQRALDDEEAPNPAPLAVVAFLAPWTLVSVMLPDPHRMASLALLVGLGLLLVGAAAWSTRAARAKNLDAARWSFYAVVTMGFSMLVLAATRPRDGRGVVCLDCGREGARDEPFCFGCGSVG